jgi:hypothetical protein
MKARHLLAAAFFWIAVFLISGCSPTGEIATAESSITAVHGPLPCVGDLPLRGYVDVFSAGAYGGTCERYRGDFSTGSSHVGITLRPSFPVRSARISAQHIQGYVATWTRICQVADGPSYAPCGSGLGHQMITLQTPSTTTVNFVPFAAPVIVVGYVATCMPTADWYAQQVGQALPYPRPPANDAYPAAVTWQRCGYSFDQSGLEATVPSDGFGDPIHLYTPSGFDTECLIDARQPPIAPGAPPALAIAVYGC